MMLAMLAVVLGFTPGDDPTMVPKFVPRLSVAGWEYWSDVSKKPPCSLCCSRSTRGAGRLCVKKHDQVHLGFCDGVCYRIVTCDHRISTQNAHPIAQTFWLGEHSKHLFLVEIIEGVGGAMELRSQ